MRNIWKPTSWALAGARVVMGSLLSAGLILIGASCSRDSAGRGTDGTRGLLAATQADVVLRCEVLGNEIRFHAELRVKVGEATEETVRQYDLVRPAGSTIAVGSQPQFEDLRLDAACSIIGSARFGPLFSFVNPVPYISVSRDGRKVAFVQDRWGLLDADVGEEGVFLYDVAAKTVDRVSNRAPCIPPFTTKTFPNPTAFAGFHLSPDGSRLVFVDCVAHEDDSTGDLEVVTLEIATGEGHQVTELGASPEHDATEYPTCCARFVSDESVLFFSTFGQSPAENGVQRKAYQVNLDGTGLRDVTFSTESRGGEVLESFSITGSSPIALEAVVDGIPRNPIECPELASLIGEEDPEEPFFLGPFVRVQEVVYVDDGLVLQLTDYGRWETALGGVALSRDGQHVFFSASVDVGENSGNHCQIFKQNILTRHIKQLTPPREPDVSGGGCVASAPPSCGCFVSSPDEDPKTGTLMFASSCDLDPGLNPSGMHIYAMNPDDPSSLRQVSPPSFACDSSPGVCSELRAVVRATSNLQNTTGGLAF